MTKTFLGILCMIQLISVNDLTVIKSEVSVHHGGVKKSGNSIIFDITIITNKPEKKITFDSLIVYNKHLPLHLKANDAEMNDKNYCYSKGDTLELTAYYRDKKLKTVNTKNLNAILIYHKKGKRKEFLIGEFTRKEDVYAY